MTDGKMVRVRTNVTPQFYYPQIQDALKLKQVKLQQLVKEEDYQQVNVR